MKNTLHRKRVFKQLYKTAIETSLCNIYTLVNIPRTQSRYILGFIKQLNFCRQIIFITYNNNRLN